MAKETETAYHKDESMICSGNTFQDHRECNWMHVLDPSSASTSLLSIPVAHPCLEDKNDQVYIDHQFLCCSHRLDFSHQHLLHSRIQDHNLSWLRMWLQNFHSIYQLNKEYIHSRNAMLSKKQKEL